MSFCCDQVGHMKKDCQKRNADMAAARERWTSLRRHEGEGRRRSIDTFVLLAASSSTFLSSANSVFAASLSRSRSPMRTTINDGERFVFALTKRKVGNVAGSLAEVLHHADVLARGVGRRGSMSQFARWRDMHSLPDGVDSWAQR